MHGAKGSACCHVAHGLLSVRVGTGVSVGRVPAMRMSLAAKAQGVVPRDDYEAQHGAAYALTAARRASRLCAYTSAATATARSFLIHEGEDVAGRDRPLFSSAVQCLNRRCRLFASPDQPCRCSAASARQTIAPRRRRWQRIRRRQRTATCSRSSARRQCRIVETVRGSGSTRDSAQPLCSRRSFDPFSLLRRGPVV